LQKSGKKLKDLSLKMVKFASLGRYILVAYEENKIVLFDYLRKDLLKKSEPKLREVSFDLKFD
jgi:hypothetical protein